MNDSEKRIANLEKIVKFLFEDYKYRNPTWDITFNSQEECDKFALESLNAVRKST